MLVSGLEVEGGGTESDISGVKWLASMTVKRIVHNTLAESFMPNWFNKAGRWRQAVQKGKFSRVAPVTVWPARIEEDDLGSSPESGGKSFKDVENDDCHAVAILV